MSKSELKKIIDDFSDRGLGSVIQGIIADKEYRILLSNAERQTLQHIESNPQNPERHGEFPGIVTKYLVWRLYNDLDHRKLRESFTNLNSSVEDSQEHLNQIRQSAKYIGGATILVEYSKSFADTAENHKQNAVNEFKKYLASLLGLAIIAFLVFFFSIAEVDFIKDSIADDLELPLNIGIFGLKAILLVFAFQVASFFKRNYNAEKHLQETYKHRSDVLQSLNAVYNSIENVEERDRILSAGALFAYERGESGYITTKEGAGSKEDIIEAIFSRTFNR